MLWVAVVRVVWCHCWCLQVHVQMLAREHLEVGSPGTRLKRSLLSWKSSLSYLSFCPSVLWSGKGVNLISNKQCNKFNIIVKLSSEVGGWVLISV